MQRRDGWHIIWLLVLVVAVFLLGVALVVAVTHRANSIFANVSSIWGLFVGLIGFFVTIYTLFETQRVSRKAQEEIQAGALEAQQAIQKAANEARAAVNNAQEQTRQILERVRHGIREADFVTLYMWLRELRAAASLGHWHRALFLSEEAPAVAERLRHAGGLEDDERQGLREGADNLRLIQAHIRNTRLDTTTTGLSAAHATNLTTLTTLLERLGGRLRYEPTKDTNP